MDGGEKTGDSVVERLRTSLCPVDEGGDGSNSGYATTSVIAWVGGDIIFMESRDRKSVV